MLRKAVFSTAKRRVSRRKTIAIVKALVGLAVLMGWVPEEVLDALPADAVGEAAVWGRGLVGALLTTWGVDQWLQRDDEDER